MSDERELLPPVEFLDTNAASGEPVDVVEVGGTPGRPVGLGVAALLIAAVGLAALVSDNEAAISPTTAPTTTEPASNTTSTSEADTSPTTTGGASSAVIGEGPELDWSALPTVDPVSIDFAWVDDAFLSTNGEHEWIVRPADDASRTLIEKRTGPLGGSPVDRQQIPAAGASAWLAPDNTVEVATDGEVLPVVLSPTPDAETDLGAPSVSHHVAVDAETVVVIRSIGFRLDPDALLARLGDGATTPGRLFGADVTGDRLTLFGEAGVRTFDVGDAELTEAEIDWLDRVSRPRLLVDAFDRRSGTTSTTTLQEPGRVASIHAFDGTFIVASFDRRYRSSDGVEWQSISSGTIADIEPGLDGLLFGLDLNSRFPRLTRSTDFGLTWTGTALPFNSPVTETGVGDLVVAVGWSGVSPAVAKWTVSKDGYRLELTDSLDSFQLTSPAGEIVQEGQINDPDSGFDFTQASIRFRWTDPDTGVEVRFDQPDFFRGYVATLAQQGQRLLVGAARWSDEGAAPVWRVRTVQETFGAAALSATIVPGPTHLLAVVDTDLGPRLFLAPVVDA